MTLWRCHCCSTWKRPSLITEVGLMQYCHECFLKIQKNILITK